MLKADANLVQAELPETDFPIFLEGFILKMLDNVAKLLCRQLTDAIIKTICIEVPDQFVFAIIGNSVQAIAVYEVIQYFQVRDLIEQACVLFGVDRDIIDQFLIHRTVAAIDHGSLLDRINEDVQFRKFQLCQVQPVNEQPLMPNIQILNSNPVFCDPIILVPVLDAEPFPLMNCAENLPADAVLQAVQPGTADRVVIQRGAHIIITCSNYLGYIVITRLILSITNEDASTTDGQKRTPTSSLLAGILDYR